MILTSLGSAFVRPSARRSRISGFACVREDEKRGLRPGGRKKKRRVREAGLRRDGVRSTPPLSHPQRWVSSIRRGR